MSALTLRHLSNMYTFLTFCRDSAIRKAEGGAAGDKGATSHIQYTAYNPPKAATGGRWASSRDGGDEALKSFDEEEEDDYEEGSRYAAGGAGGGLLSYLANQAGRPGPAVGGPRGYDTEVRPPGYDHRRVISGAREHDAYGNESVRVARPAAIGLADRAALRAAAAAAVAAGRGFTGGSAHVQKYQWCGYATSLDSTLELVVSCSMQGKMSSFLQTSTVAGRA